MVKNRIDVITLGCSKNLVDSESLMRQFRAAGYDVYADAPEVKGEIVVINTCGFIGDAKEESIQMILSCAQAKSRHKIGRLYVMGCLSQRYREELAQEIPEVDKFYGKFDYPALLTDLGKAYREEYRLERELTTPSHYAYLKIAEGCDRLCAYCAIPLITGRYVSRPMEDILAETERLVSRGVKEFQVIAQDLTYYGKDLYGRFCIAELIDRMAAIPGVEWIRLHYAYPDRFPMDLLPVMAQRKNVCRYLDIALQHSSDSVLARMRRRVTRAETETLLARIREEVPGIHLRTTLMVGFPGESEADFEELLQFVRRMRFERMGAFAYSEEEGTYSAAHYKDDVPDAVKRQRLDRLMAEQEAISAEINQSKVGQRLRVIVDREEEEYYVGRTEYDSPEVDPEVLIEKTSPLTIGSFYEVTVTAAQPFELFARTESSPSL
ncbi:MAG: 30S ribosomal protein S12 methylthiotransferase RimO [Porphyromonadaceae bacterium]|nr:30S ribosomal protein S12 methylthiotransferase RimO [Porphyromonadaceae bacterium]